jgi:hypothetical protein
MASDNVKENSSLCITVKYKTPSAIVKSRYHLFPGGQANDNNRGDIRPKNSTSHLKHPDNAALWRGMT